MKENIIENIELKFNKILVMLVGNIGSGKSTVAKHIIKKLGAVCISRDGLRYMIGNGNYVFNTILEKSIRKIELFALETYMKELGINIIVDETNMSDVIRKKLIDLANKYKYKKIAYVLPRLSKAASVKRRLLTPHGSFTKEEWEYVYDGFDSIYVKPTKKERFDKIVYHSKNKGGNKWKKYL